MGETGRGMVWVYGVVPAGVRLEELRRRRGRLPGGVRVVEVGDLGVIVGAAPGEDAKAIRDQALAHARVLEVAVLDAPVVPFRFGMVVEDDGLESELEPWRDQLGSLLESVRGYVQLTLKASYREDVVLREVVERDPEIASLREQTRGRDEFAMREQRMRLGELIGLALEGLRDRDAGEMLERLGPVAAASRVDALESEYMVLNAPFLVARGRVQEFEDVAGALADEQAGRMRLTLQGPMPAFDFIGAEQMPWA